MAGEGIALFPRLAKVTLAHWKREMADHAYKNNVFLKMLKARKGVISAVDGGGQMRWPFRKKKFNIDPYIPGEVLQFDRTQIEENASLRWGGYLVKEAILDWEKLEHKGRAQIVEVLKNRLKFMTEDANERLSQQFYVDGNLAANAANRTFHGLESFMKITPGSQTNTDELATVLADTYGGHSTSYTTFGGTTEVDPEYGVWSPVIVNTNRTVGGSVRAFADYGDEYIRSGIINSTYGPNERDQIDAVILTKAAYQSTLNLLDDKERVNFMRGTGVGQVKFGFPVMNGFEIDGVPCTWDLGLPATDVDSDTVHGYGLNTHRMKLCLLGAAPKELWRTQTEYDVHQLATLLVLSLAGNMQVDSPRYFVKFADIS